MLPTENVEGLGPFLLKSLSGYPSSTGTINLLMPPGFIEATASSIAGMAVCAPNLKLKSSLSAPRPNEPPLACNMSKLIGCVGNMDLFICWLPGGWSFSPYCGLEKGDPAR